MSDLFIEQGKVGVWFQQYECVWIGIVPFFQPGAFFQRQVVVEQQIELLGGICRVGLKNTPDHKIAGEFVPVIMNDLTNDITGSAKELLCKRCCNSDSLFV